MKIHKERSYKKQFLIASALVAVLLLAMLVLLFLFGRPMLRFVSEPELFRAWVDSHGLWGSLLYVAMTVFQVVVAIVPGEPFEIAAGYAFGVWQGTLLCLVGATLGSIVVFLLVKRFGMKIVRFFFSEEKLTSVRFLQTSPRRNALFFVIFMIPGTPKDLLCYYAGLTDMRLGQWLLVSSIGRLPSIVTSTIGGGALGTEKYLFAVITFAVTLTLSAMGLLIYRAISKRHLEKRE